MLTTCLRVCTSVSSSPPPGVVPAAEPIVWEQHSATSCKEFAGDDEVPRSLEDSKEVCAQMPACRSIMCPRGKEDTCTVRHGIVLHPMSHEDCYTAPVRYCLSTFHPRSWKGFLHCTRTLLPFNLSPTILERFFFFFLPSFLFMWEFQFPGVFPHTV